MFKCVGQWKTACNEEELREEEGKQTYKIKSKNSSKWKKQRADVGETGKKPPSISFTALQVKILKRRFTYSSPVIRMAVLNSVALAALVHSNEEGRE